MILLYDILPLNGMAWTPMAHAPIKHALNFQSFLRKIIQTFF